MPKIYVAGPLFTEGERWLLERIDGVCREAGYETYLPHRDAGVFDRDSDSSFFLQQDLQRLQEANVVVAVLNRKSKIGPKNCTTSVSAKGDCSMVPGGTTTRRTRSSCFWKSA